MNNKKILILFGITLIIGIIGIIIYNLSSSYSIIENDSRVAPNSELTYYIDVIYDGIDKNVTVSNDTTTARVYSDYIYVEDKLPEGLIFKNFITAEDGSVGAVKRDGSGSCGGYVVGNSEGLVYNEETRMVSFKVKSLQAGCKITVGIVTQTPELGDKKRIDFYNTAVARENDFTTISNTIHVYMGKEDLTMYNVNYEYIGTIPDNAPEPPSGSSYTSGSNIGVENNITVAGYNFSGWTTNDVEVTNGSFTMPETNVTFTGSFTKKTEYNVSYRIEGEYPSEYTLPSTKSYGVGDDVIIDSLSNGDIINGYKFLGWTNNSLDLSDGIFVMPETNVELVGSFEKVTYKITYAFQGAELPPDYETLLPNEETYLPGEMVTLADYPTAPEYEFLGWYHKDNFKMPEENITIYGEWMRQNGTFSPIITKEIVDRKDIYHNGDKVKFKITVTNNENYEIKEVLLRDNLEGAYFIEGTGYNIKSEKNVIIPSILPNSSVIVYAEYNAPNDLIKEYTNEVELTGALADNNYTLDTNHEYKSSVNFIVSNIKLVINKVNRNEETLQGAEYTLYSDRTCNNKISSGLEFDLNPNTTYYLRETKAPNGYQISNSIIEINVSNTGVVTANDYNMAINNNVNTITLIDDKINLLPNTGGMGNYIFIISGIILAIGSYIIYKVINKKEEVKK